MKPEYNPSFEVPSKKIEQMFSPYFHFSMPQKTKAKWQGEAEPQK
jgi:hypothetical protein